MIITLTTKTSYDLNQASEFKNFRNNVNRMLRNGNRDSELRHIVQKLESHPELESKLAVVHLKIKTYLANKDETKSEKNTKTEENKDTKLAQWQKTGQHSFERMYIRLIEDVKEFHGNFDFMVAYSAHILNMFMHMATVTPHQHHAASQKREYDSGYCLQYGRSQGKHPNANLYRKLGGFRVSNRLPFNTAYYKMLKDIDPKGFAKISQFEPTTGEPKKGKKPGSYANLSIAHAGLRRNNLDIIIKGLTLAGDKEDDGQQAVLKQLTSILPVPAKAFKNADNIGQIFRAYRNQFNNLPNIPIEKGIGRQIMDYRFHRVSGLEAKINAANLTKITVKTTQKNTTCLYLRLYPGFKTSKAAIKEGVTNTLIAIFSGILQLKLEQKNIFLRAERRQSFGFLRPTLTDAGVLTMRLSLGIEPKVFDEVVLESLTEMDEVLSTFDFQKQTDATVKKILAIKNPDVNKKGQYTYIQSAVASDRKTLLTFNQAQAYIQQVTKNNTLIEAVRQFFCDFILAEKPLTLSLSKRTKSAVDTKPKKVIGLLQNTIAYAKRNALLLTFDEDSCPFKHTCLHAYKKLYKNIAEAIILLNNQDNLKADDIFHQATRYIENIIEYSLILTAFDYPNRVKQNPAYDPVKILQQTELTYCAHHLGLDRNQINVFFTDSGQQAINLPMLFYGHMYKHSDTDNACIQLFGDTYFEISSFFDDIKKDNVPTTTSSSDKAKVLVVDISQIQQLNAADFPNLATCIIDLTHQPDVNNFMLKERVNQLLEYRVSVVLSTSLLKHEQLGQDKYQSGRFFLISPGYDFLPAKETIDEFQSVSDEAMNPYLASAFNLFNEIADVKFDNQEPSVCQFSLFNNDRETLSQSASRLIATRTL